MDPLDPDESFRSYWILLDPKVDSFDGTEVHQKLSEFKKSIKLTGIHKDTSVPTVIYQSKLLFRERSPLGSLWILINANRL